MIKALKKLAVLSILFLSTSAFAQNCGMKPDGRQAELSSEICTDNYQMFLLGTINKHAIIDNPLIKNDQIVIEFREKIENDYQFKIATDANLEKTSELGNLIEYSLLFFGIILFSMTVFKIVTSNFANDIREASEYSALKDIALKAVGTVVFLKTVYGFTPAGWFIVFLITLGNQLGDASSRAIQLFSDSYLTTSSPIGETDSFDSNNIKVNYSNIESQNIIDELTTQYGIMDQTDKAYRSALDLPPLRMPETFIHPEGNKINFYRKMPDSEIVEYFSGHIENPYPSLEFTNGVLDSLNLEEKYVTGEITEIEGNLQSAKTEIMEFIKTKNNNSLQVNNVIDTLFLMSAAKVRENTFKELWNEGYIANIYKPMLKQACYDNAEGQFSKRYYDALIAGQNFNNVNGKIFCIWEDKGKYELLGYNNDYTTTKARSSDRSVQNAWFAEQLAAKEVAVNFLHETNSKLAAIRIGLGLTNDNLNIRQKAAASSFNYLLVGTQYYWTATDQKNLTRTLFIGSGVKLVSRGSEKNLINYEFLSKGKRKAFAESLLDFSFYIDLMKSETKRDRNKEENTTSSESILKDRIENSESLGKLNTFTQKFLTSPLQSFSARLGISGKCRDRGECENPVYNVQQSMTAFGNDLIYVSTTAKFMATGAIISGNILNSVTGSKSSSKANIGEKAASSKFAKSLNSMGNIMSLFGGVTGFIMNFVFIAGVFLAKVLPFASNFPFIMAYHLFTIFFIALILTINFMFISVMTPNDNNNIEAIKRRAFVLSIIVLATPSLLVLIKTLCVMVLNVGIYVIAMLLFRFNYTGSIFDTMLLLAMIGFSLSLVTGAIVRACYSILTIFYEKLGSRFFINDQPLETINALNVFIAKVMPGMIALRMVFAANAKKALSNMTRKKGDNN